jgi:hypothetical protein
VTTDLTLVSRRSPTMSALRAGVFDAALSAVELVGDWDADEPLVEVSADVSAGELFLQVFRPTVSLTGAADPYTVRIGLQPPLDAAGQCWLTHMAMSAQASEEQILAALAIVRRLALAGEGFLVVNGEYTPVADVAPPARLQEGSWHTAPVVPPARAFVTAFLTPRVDGEAGWQWSTELLRWLLGQHRAEPDLRPRLIKAEGEWRPFLPGGPVPQWWPLRQHLLTPDPHLEWRLDPAFGPADRYTTLDISGDLDPEVTETFLPQLVELADRHLAYGFVHAWHPEEAVAPAGLRVGDDSRPWLLLGPRDLTSYLPNLYWAQIFGPPWVELFGADTLASTPAFRVEEVAPGHWLVQLTEHLADVVDEHVAFEAVRSRAKSHLGADAFFSAERGPSGPYRAPHIPTLLERGLVPAPAAPTSL